MASLWSHSTHLTDWGEDGNGTVTLMMEVPALHTQHSQTNWSTGPWREHTYPTLNLMAGVRDFVHYVCGDKSVHWGYLVQIHRQDIHLPIVPSAAGIAWESKETPGWGGKLVMQQSRRVMSPRCEYRMCSRAWAEVTHTSPLVSGIVLPKSQKRKSTH